MDVGEAIWLMAGFARFGTKRPQVQVLSPRPFNIWYLQAFSLLFFYLQDMKCTILIKRNDYLKNLYIRKNVNRVNRVNRVTFFFFFLFFLFFFL